MIRGRCGGVITSVWIGSPSPRILAIISSRRFLIAAHAASSCSWLIVAPIRSTLNSAGAVGVAGLMSRCLILSRNSGGRSRASRATGSAAAVACEEASIVRAFATNGLPSHASQPADHTSDSTAAAAASAGLQPASGCGL